MTTEADVVVVGGGPAGLSAAVEAARAGASVTVVEALPQIGGNAAISSAYCAFLDSELQRLEGVADSEDAFVADIVAEVERQRDRYGIVFDEAFARRFVAETRDAYSFLAGLGMHFGRIVPRPLQHTVSRMIVVENTTEFRSCFERVLSDLRVDVLVGMRAERLLLEGGRVVGILTEGGDDIRGRRGVVLTTGGYQGSRQLRLLYQPERLAKAPFIGLESCRGDGHVMGQALGARLINMTMIPTVIQVASALVSEVIAVNGYGERFHDEAGPYDDRVDALLAQPEAIGYYVFDDPIARVKAGYVAELPEAPRKAPTLARLAELIGCEAETLARTVHVWNQLVESDATKDPAFGRVIFPTPRRPLAEPPFYAAPMVVGANFTSGGFTVTPSMQVVDVYDEPIPGLYSAGDCIGGINPATGLGGIHIVSAVALGRVAGHAAAGAV